LFVHADFGGFVIVVMRLTREVRVMRVDGVDEREGEVTNIHVAHILHASMASVWVRMIHSSVHVVVHSY
jgi:hypothetical protein